MPYRLLALQGNRTWRNASSLTGLPTAQRDKAKRLAGHRLTARDWLAKGTGSMSRVVLPKASVIGEKSGMLSTTESGNSSNHSEKPDSIITRYRRHWSFGARRSGRDRDCR
jgi:hypothetical protein